MFICSRVSVNAWFLKIVLNFHSIQTALVFVFMALLEYAVVNYSFYGRRRMLSRQRHSQPGFKIRKIFFGAERSGGTVLAKINVAERSGGAEISENFDFFNVY